jgi:alkyl hydroperoxide reductase subunit AhpC
MNVELLSIAFDSAAEQTAGAAQVGITDTPMLIDADHQVSRTYDVLKWAVATGEPGHTFILVDADGSIAWIRDYGAPPNGVMYVDSGELVDQMQAALN